MTGARRTRRFRSVLALTLVAACAADDGIPGYSSEPPTRAEAQALLDRAAALARAGDEEGLCQLGFNELGCTDALLNVGPVPDEAPRVVHSRVYEELGAADGGSPAARILGLCIGDLYSEVAVYRHSSGELDIHNPVYWTGASIVQPRILDDATAEADLDAFPDQPVDC